MNSKNKLIKFELKSFTQWFGEYFSSVSPFLYLLLFRLKYLQISQPWSNMGLIVWLKTCKAVLILGFRHRKSLWSLNYAFNAFLYSSSCAAVNEPDAENKIPSYLYDCTHSKTLLSRKNFVFISLPALLKTITFVLFTFTLRHQSLQDSCNLYSFCWRPSAELDNSTISSAYIRQLVKVPLICIGSAVFSKYCGRSFEGTFPNLPRGDRVLIIIPSDL